VKYVVTTRVMRLITAAVKDAAVLSSMGLPSRRLRLEDHTSRISIGSPERLLTELECTLSGTTWTVPDLVDS
jgi:hypothetical protein